MNPLSVKYDHGFAVSHTWDGKPEPLSTVISQTQDDRHSLNKLKKVFVRLFDKSEPFRKAILATDPDCINCELIESETLPKESVDVYVSCLVHFAKVAKLVVNFKPEELVPTMVNIVEMSQAPQYPWEVTYVDIAEILSKHNLYAADLSKHFRSLFNEKIKPSVENGRPTPLRPVTFLGWGGPNSLGQSYGLNADTFRDGFIEVRCDNWSKFGGTPGVIADWCSGIDVLTKDYESITLAIDPSKIKSEVSIGGKMVPTAECGAYVVAIEECGEFDVEIYFKPTIHSKDKTELFFDDYCCK